MTIKEKSTREFIEEAVAGFKIGDKKAMATLAIANSVNPIRVAVIRVNKRLGMRLKVSESADRSIVTISREA